MATWPTIVLCVCLVLQVQRASSQQEVQLRRYEDAMQNVTGLDFILQDYLTNDELVEHLRNFTQRRGCAEISTMRSIGQTRDGNDLWVLEISNNPGRGEAKPNFKYIGNMHGDEPSGRVLQLAFAEWLCAEWQKDERAKRLVEETKISLLPTMNPDGFAARIRGNGAYVDLNRDFPDPLERSNESLEAEGTEQPETLAIMEWVRGTHFVASASMHEGAFVANYPWDGNVNMSTSYSASPDDATFKHLALSYAILHPKMKSSEEFKRGITNGAAWYPLKGGMQDWNYLAGSCMELTLELSQSKYPPGNSLKSLWLDNKESMINFPMTALFGGLSGFIMEDDGSGLRPLLASIAVLGMNWTVSSNSRFGDYYRPLAPGSYDIEVLAPGYKSEIAAVTIPGNGNGVQKNFTLQLLDQGQGGTVRGAEAANKHGRKRGRFLEASSEASGFSSNEAFSSWNFFLFAAVLLLVLPAIMVFGKRIAGSCLGVGGRHHAAGRGQ